MELSERRAEALRGISGLPCEGRFIDFSQMLILASLNRFGDLASLVLKTFGESVDSIRIADALWEG